MGKFNEKQAAEAIEKAGMERPSTSEVARAWHQARDDAAASSSSGGRGGDPGRFSRDDDSGREATSFWESIFGKKER